ncbi:hypothetical protein Lesp02_38460 [Lentzea sp. NBRC 105346]|uniref:lasso peptide biosynthesis B2 protein n=1 Tax=Lentzea sp. NBRC 105346 TaxID=3032205 RepID=UPI00249FC2E0|nr:lasso peptide biosynthesis B2 protein [Lentzea sp. NBRC 105346]GLZ31658.1 hypothetical protein Lesp02_38460 [Lentzea sp. NBRC 105346]
MRQTLERSARPPLRRRPAVHLAVWTALLLAKLPPRRIVTVLSVVRRGAAPAGYDDALLARNDVVGVSVRCAGRYCLPRAIATALLCRMRGVWPTWRVGVHTAPFAAHSWVEAEGRAVDEPYPDGHFSPILSV